MIITQQTQQKINEIKLVLKLQIFVLFLGEFYLMFQQILALRSNEHIEEPSFQEQFLFDTFHKHNSTDIFSPIFQHSLEQPCKDTTEYSSIKTPSPHKIVKQKKKRIRKYTSNNPNNQKGHWTNQQNLKYHYFLELHALYFIDDQKRKTDKVFKSMASFIETREPHQCRSHHQKVQKKWGSFPNILVNLRLENFRKVDAGPLMRQLERLGYQNSSILTENDLMNEEELYKKILNQPVKENTFIDDPKTQQSISQLGQDKQSRCHKQNCMCLMMSETYEDQLQI